VANGHSIRLRNMWPSVRIPPSGHVLRFRCCTVTFCSFHVRVARWFIFKPTIPIWVNFVGP
jgi:hypothetical protein